VELRVHGIGGPDPDRVLGATPKSSVVSWRSEPRTKSVVRCLPGKFDVNVYHWSPLTSGSRSFAVWPLLLPFTLINVAGWMAPPGTRAYRRVLHRLATVWVALATTAAMVVWLLVAFLAVWNDVGGDDLRRRSGGISAWYFAAVAASAALAMFALVFTATYMSAGFERFRPKSWPEETGPQKRPWADTSLEDPGFYDNGREHKTWWYIHVAVAVVTFGIAVVLVYRGGTDRAGHVLGRTLLAVGLAQALGVAVMAVASLLPDPGDKRRLTRRLLGAAAATLGIVLLGGLVLSALISFTGLDAVPPGPVAVLYDCYGYAVLVAAASALLCVVFTLLTPVDAEARARPLLPTLGARLRARLATILSKLDVIVTMLAIGFAVAAGAAMAARWSAIVDDSWTLTATTPVNIARSTFAFVLAFTGINLVKSRASPSSLKRIGNVWDILTFWPRTFHPLAVRPYAERAVPELQEFIRAAPRTGRLVVAAHSQGTVLAFAAIRPFITETGCTLPPFALVTFGSPLQSLYAELFPSYFARADFIHTRERIVGGWVNCFRFTDHVGRSVFGTDAEATEDHVAGRAAGDQPIADARSEDGKVNGHNDYWPETLIRAAVLAGEGTKGGNP